MCSTLYPTLRFETVTGNVVDAIAYFMQNTNVLVVDFESGDDLCAYMRLEKWEDGVRIYVHKTDLLSKEAINILGIIDNFILPSDGSFVIYCPESTGEYLHPG